MTEERDQHIKRIDDHCHQLMERYDSVQVFVTKHTEIENGGTIHFNRGCGNWMARYGQIQEWMIYEDERIRINCKENSL